MDQERAARYSDLFESKHNHSSDCAYCPICATIAVVRNTRPEVLDHLAAAARELVIAAGLLVEEAGGIVGAPGEPKTPTAEPETKLRRVDIG